MPMDLEKQDTTVTELQKSGFSREQALQIISILGDLQKAAPQIQEKLFAQARKAGLENAVRYFHERWQQTAPKKMDLSKLSDSQRSEIFKEQRSTALSDREFFSMVSLVRRDFYQGKIGKDPEASLIPGSSQKGDKSLYDKIGRMCSAYEQLDRSDPMAVRMFRAQYELSLGDFLDIYCNRNKAEISEVADKMGSVPVKI